MEPADNSEADVAGREREQDEVAGGAGPAGAGAIHIVFNALKPFQAAHDAVIRALERAAEKERRT
jgi:hypothetical protein